MELFYGPRTEIAPKGLSEDITKPIFAKKNEPEWLLYWRLKAYWRWTTLTPPGSLAFSVGDRSYPGDTPKPLHMGNDRFVIPGI